MSYVEFANSENQREIAKLLDEGLSATAAAKRLNKDPGTTRRAASQIKSRAAKKDRKEHIDTTPDGFGIKKTSTFYDREGSVSAQWVIRHQEAERQAELMKEYISGLCESFEPAKPKKYPANALNTEIMPAIFIGDAHIGMQAYAAETRHSDFNVEIACQQLRDAADYLIDRADPAETGLLVDVGDFLHPNGRLATTLNGTPLDTDQTYYGMMKAAGHVMRYIIDKMLTKFGRVVNVVTPGNHNTDPAIGLQIALEFLYSNEPRVTILKNEGFYNYIEYGNWLLGFCHGDKQKPESLVANMARDMASAWGRTTHRMWCTGHYHKETVRTFPGCKHKVFGALPPPDSWHAGQGYLGDGEMEMLTFRKEGGLHSSHVYNIPQPRMEPDVRI